MYLFQRYKKAVISLLTVLLSSAVAIFLAYLAIHFFHFLRQSDNEEVHFFIFIATLFLAVIAYYEFSRSNKLIANEFLLFTSNRWNSTEIIRARQILHKIFIEAYRDKNGDAKCEFEAALSLVSEKILQMSRSKGKDGDNFIYLLNLLDYLETLSYFYYRGDLTLPDIQNTCGNNIIFFYNSFKYFIEKRQSHDKKFFINFTGLYHDLKKFEINDVRKS